MLKNVRSRKIKVIDMGLYGLEPLRDMLKLALATARIKPVKPISVLILAKPESGKTQSLEEFKYIPFVHYTNDITAKTVVDLIFPGIDTGEFDFLMIPDLLNCIKKNQSTRDRVIHVIKTLIEEGYTRIDCLNMKYTPQHKKVLRCGFISALTTDGFMEVRREWSDIGFLSRMLPFSYQYDRGKVEEIMAHIAKEQKVETEFSKDKFPGRPVDIKADENLMKTSFQPLATGLASEFGGYGFRYLHQLITLAKASALLNKRNEVTQEDVDRVIKLAKWMNFEFNMI